MTKHFLINENKYKNVLIEAHRLIYFELPKNACTSMKTQFAEVLQLPKHKDFPRYIHRHERYVFPLAAEKEILTTYKDYLRFAIIRNPWERLVSCYKDKIFYKDEDNAYFIKTNPQFSRGMSFADFVDLVASIPDHLADFHFCSQLALLTDFAGNFMCNYLANLDNLNIHFDKIKTATGVPFETIPHRLNTTKKSSYEDYYTPELVEKVRQRYHWDIEFFDYEFGKKNEAFSFGFLSKEQEKMFKNPEFVISILKEKNKELQGIIAKTDKNAENYKEEVQQSLSWKITKPLRGIAEVVNLTKSE
jgi:hypothetical protein